MYDLVIVGAGPSGATLARLLGKEKKILILDRRQLDYPKELGSGSGLEKCCGGLIAPDAQQMLARMGLGVPREVLVGPQIFTVRTIDVQANRERYYQRHYINIDRERFDSWLTSLLPSTVDRRWGSSLQSFEQIPEGLKVNYTWQGQKYQVETKYLIGADGAASSVRRRLKPEIEPKRYISIQEWFRVKNSTAYYSAIFDREITDFYSWTIPKEEYMLVGAALIPNEQASEKFDLLKDKLERYGFNLQDKVKRNGAFIIRPTSTGQLYLGQDNILLVGEAAGWISPTSAEGLSYAFRSSLALAQSFLESPDQILRGYTGKTQKLRANITLKNLKAPFMYNDNLRNLALKSGLLSLDVHKQI